MSRPTIAVDDSGRVTLGGHNHPPCKAGDIIAVPYHKCSDYDSEGDAHAPSRNVLLRVIETTRGEGRGNPMFAPLAFSVRETEYEVVTEEAVREEIPKLIDDIVGRAKQ